MLIGLVLLTIGLLGLAGTWVVHGKQSRAWTEGVRLQAVVTGKDLVYAADGSSDHLVVYRFLLPGGQIVVGRQPLEPARWTSIRRGDMLSLAVVPDEPQRARLVEAGPPGLLLPLFLSAVCLPFAALGLFMLAPPRRV